MGCFGGGSEEAGAADQKNRRASRAIEKEIEKDRSAYASTRRLLLLGAGESGKSTFVKQMRILHIDGFSVEERIEKIDDIKRNLRDAILTITGAMAQLSPPVEVGDPDLEDSVDYIQDVASSPGFEFPPAFFDHTHKLWHDSGVQDCFSRANEYQLIDCAKYFLDRTDEIADPTYLPSEQDVLRCRVLTSGIVETKFGVEGVHFHIFDVGGQRDERKKWIQVFNDVTAILFMAAASGYDLTLREDASQNRLSEAIALFKMVWGNRWLGSTSVIIFLNKQDLLEEKIKKGVSKIETYFPDYADYKTPDDAKVGPEEHPEVARAQFFIRDLFLKYSSKDKSGKRYCYYHFTCAVDTENVRKVFNDCRSIIQRLNMSQLDLI